MKMNAEEFKRFLKAKLAEGGMTSGEASEIIDMHFTNFSRNLNHGKFSYLSILTLADALGYDIVWEKKKDK